MEKNEEETNIISFPSSKIIKDRTTSGDIENLLKLKYALVNEYMNMILPWVYRCLKISGFEASDKDNFKDWGLVIEALRSFLEKQYGIENQLQQFSDNFFTVNEQGDLTYTGKLNITIDEKIKQQQGSNTDTCA